MDSKTWLQKASQELTALAPDAHKNSADAWRAMTLLARLLASPTGLLPPSLLSQSLQELIEVAGLPNPEDILDMVVSGLESDTDAWGQLLDGLIDADDALCVLSLVGDDQAANELAVRVAALVSLYPERVVGLSAFAQMRLETVSEASLIAYVWRAVERAPGQLLAEALPAQVQSGADELTRLASKHPWLDALYSKLRRVFDEGEVAAAGILASFKSAGAQPDLAASLSASNDAPNELELVWGELSRVELAVGESVELEVPLTCQLWYSLSSGTLLFPQAKWLLERDESPVLIIATESSDAQTLEDALERGVRAAGLVLVERSGIVSNTTN